MQNIVLVLVIIISLWAHVWMFRFMRFKIDEGCVLRFLLDRAGDDNNCTIKSIANAISLSESRVERACTKSKSLSLVDGQVCLLK